MDIVKIVPSGDGMARSTKVFTKDGSEIPGILQMTITFDPNNFVEAEMTLIASMEETWALPFMSEASFLVAAERYGYRVEKKDPAQ